MLKNGLDNPNKQEITLKEYNELISDADNLSMTKEQIISCLINNKIKIIANDIDAEEVEEECVTASGTLAATNCPIDNTNLPKYTKDYLMDIIKMVNDSPREAYNTFLNRLLADKQTSIRNTIELVKANDKRPPCKKDLFLALGVNEANICQGKNGSVLTAEGDKELRANIRLFTKGP